MDLAELIQERASLQPKKQTTIFNDIISAVITLSFFWLMLIFLLATAKR